MGTRCLGWLRRHWRAAAMLGVFLTLVVAWIAMSWPIPLEERVRRIQPGMTTREVEAVMGQPPGNYTRYSDYARVIRGGSLPDDRSFDRIWVWDDAIVTVWFDADGRVKETVLKRRDVPLVPFRSWLE